VREFSFGPMLVVSGALHVAFLGFLLYSLSFEARKPFVAPYVQVELVGPGVQGEKRLAKPISSFVAPPKAKEPLQLEPKKPIEPQKPTQPKREVIPKDAMSLPQKQAKPEPKPKTPAKKAHQETQVKKRIRPPAKTEEAPGKAQEALDSRLESAIERIRHRLAQKEGAPLGAFLPGSGTGQPIDPRLARYISEIWQRLMLNFSLPPTLREIRGLEAVVIVRIGPQGETLSVSTEKSSGNPLYDQAVYRAIKESAPFPPFPEAIGSSFFELGIRFRPEDIG
jgi:TonB family protein